MDKLENEFMLQQIKTNTTMKLKLNWFTYHGRDNWSKTSTILNRFVKVFSFVLKLKRLKKLKP